jgi:hypothetical protein
VVLLLLLPVRYMRHRPQQQPVMGIQTDTRKAHS